jgi:predicted amidohydrolase YtcJ
MTAATSSQTPGPVLYTGIVLYSTQDPEASALLVEDGTVAWIGPVDTALKIHADAQRVEATGCLLTPGFVDCVPTSDGSAPDGSWQQAALSRGVTHHVAGLLPGRHDGIEVATPVDAPVPYLSLSRDGVPIAFGSGGRDSAIDPWTWVRAAAHEGPEDQRISDRAAFLASSRAGHRLAGRPHPGSLNPGAPASFVVWEPWDLTVRGQDERIQTWSTDPRSRTPMLPDLTEGSPSALRTLVDGEVVFDRLSVDAR